MASPSETGIGTPFKRHSVIVKSRGPHVDLKLVTTYPPPEFVGLPHTSPQFGLVCIQAHDPRKPRRRNKRRGERLLRRDQAQYENLVGLTFHAQVDTKQNRWMISKWLQVLIFEIEVEQPVQLPELFLVEYYNLGVDRLEIFRDLLRPLRLSSEFKLRRVDLQKCRSVYDDLYWGGMGEMKTLREDVEICRFGALLLSLFKGLIPEDSDSGLDNPDPKEFVQFVSYMFSMASQIQFVIRTMLGSGEEPTKVTVLRALAVRYAGDWQRPEAFFLRTSSTTPDAEEVDSS